MTLYETEAFAKELGILRLEVWQEGIVLWVGGQIRFASFPRVCEPVQPASKTISPHLAASPEPGRCEVEINAQNP